MQYLEDMKIRNSSIAILMLLFMSFISFVIYVPYNSSGPKESVETSDAPSVFGVSTGDMLIYNSHLGLHDKIIIDGFDDSEGYWQCQGRIFYWDSDSSAWIERYNGGLAAEEPWVDHGISYEGYITPIPIDWDAQNESISGGIIGWSLPYTVEGRTMRVTDPSDPTYSANLTYNENGVLTRFEEIWGEDYEWWELIHYGHDEISIPGSSDFNISGPFNYRIQMEMTVTDNVNTSVEYSEDNPIGVDFVNGKFFIKIICNDTSSVSFPVTLTIHYDDEDLALWGLTESRLQLYYYNDNGGFWENLMENVDTTANTISVQLQHFSLYSFGEGELPGNGGDVPGFSITLMTLISFGAIVISVIYRRNKVEIK